MESQRAGGNPIGQRWGGHSDQLLERRGRVEEAASRSTSEAEWEHLKDAKGLRRG